jgi:hypothetical protein
VSGVRFKGRYTPREIKAESMALVLDAVFDGAWMEAKVRLELKRLTFVTEFEGVDRRIASVLEKVFAGIEDANAEVAMTFEGASLAGFKAETDLAETVARSFRDALSAEIEEVKKEALKMLDEKTGEPMEAARRAVDLFAEKGKGAVNPAVQDSTKAQADLSSEGGRVGGRMKELEGLLQVEGDPAKAVAEKEKELDSLEGNLDKVGADFTKDREAQEKALAEAVKLLEGEKGRKGAADKDLKSETARLKALIKKASPW